MDQSGLHRRGEPLGATFRRRQGWMSTTSIGPSYYDVVESRYALYSSRGQ